jgi:DnaK suppressor protein
MLSENKKAYFKKRLMKELHMLQKRADDPVSDLSDLWEESQDFADQATMETDLDFMLHLKSREAKLILKIQEALERIEDGSYGICDECGEDISLKRLEVRPVTTLCIACKTRQEAQEKHRGL